MRKDPEKKQAGKERRKKRLAAIISICLSIAVVITAIAGTIAYTMTNQLPQDEKQFSEKERKVLLQTFQTVTSEKKQPLRRVIDSQNPLNLVNYYGDEPLLTLWNSIPENQQPYTVLLLIPGHTLLPGSDQALAWLETTADECEKNQIPYAIQNINGEYQMEERIPIAWLEERFASRHDYFYGLNAAELYNGVIWRGEVESNNAQYIIDCITLAAKYGAFFFWTDTNMNYDNGMVLEWFEKNDAFYSAFKNNAANIVLMNKESYGNPSSYSVMQGLWLAGLVGNWGVASDWWHWQVDGDKKSLFGEYDKYVDDEWDLILSYPENMYVQSMMLVMSCGGTCFKAEAPNFSTSNGGKPIAGFQYGISPLFDAILNGEITIPSREDMLKETPAAVLGRANYPDFHYNLKESNLYPSTGRYRILPLLPSNLRQAERELFTQNGIALIAQKQEQADYDALFPEQAQGDSYAMRIKDQWYFINNLENAQGVKTASMTPLYSNASSFSITAQEHTSAIVTERQDRLSFYLSNYRTDKGEMIKAATPEIRKEKSWVNLCGEYLTLDENGNPLGVDDSEMRETTITVTGTLNGGAPKLILRSNMEGGGQTRPFTHTTKWDPDTQTLTVTIRHNGVVKLDILLDQAEGELTLPEKKPLSNSETPTPSVSTTALQKAVNNCKLPENEQYIDYTYLIFQSALEQAKRILTEGAVSQQEVDQAQKALEDAYREMLPVSEYVALLNEIFTMDLTGYAQNAIDKLWLSFDALLREVLSNQVYVTGRSNELQYKSVYRERTFQKTEKRQALEEKYAALRQARNSLLDTKTFS